MSTGRVPPGCSTLASPVYTYTLLDDGLRSYTYDHANRLVQVVSGTFTTTFAYNGDGHRVAKAENGVATSYVVAVLGLSQVLVETTGGQTTRYVYGHDLLAEHDGEAWVWHLNDGLGSVRQLVGRSGDVTLAQGYTPFGMPLWSQGSGETGYGFTGERWEAYSGLVFLRARYYEPRAGRFLSRDPWGGDHYQPQTLLRSYLYVLNNPTNHTDPSGRAGQFQCNWPDTDLSMLLDGQWRKIDNQLCQELDDPGASLKLIQDFYRRVVVPASMLNGAPDAALLLERSLEEKTTPYQVSLRLGRQLMAVPSHMTNLRLQEQIWLKDLKQQALSMSCDDSGLFDHTSPALHIQAYNAGETTNVKFAMGPHTAWFTWQGTIIRTCNGWDVWGMLGRDIADFSDWHGAPHDYDGDGDLECPGGQCDKIASFDLANLPGWIPSLIRDKVVPPGQTNTTITIPDDWMARLVVGGEASNPGFGIYFNTREWFGFNVTDWAILPTVKYGGLD